MSFPHSLSSSVRNVLGLARPTTTPWHRHLDLAVDDTYVTTPASALLCPSLCAPTGELTVPDVVVDDRRGERTAAMPTRRRTRAQTGHTASPPNADKTSAPREAQRKQWEDAYFGNFPHVGDDDPPPF
jgi:hypothetical protein